MKTTQVQIWLEVRPFDKKVYFEFEHNNMDSGVFTDCRLGAAKVLSTKIKKDKCGLVLRENETRESIIEALEDYQKSILPDKYFMQQVSNGIFIRDKNREEYFNYFYCDATRIITITDFRE